MEVNEKKVVMATLLVAKVCFVGDGVCVLHIFLLLLDAFCFCFWSESGNSFLFTCGKVST